VAFVAVTVSVEVLPDVIDVGLAAMVTVGAGLVDALTVTVAVEVTVPPGPVAVAVYVVVFVGVTGTEPPSEGSV
jgi:hypothetical protein